MASDAEIIDAVLGGDIERYAELVTQYQHGAWRLAYSLVGNMDDAKELSQNAFVKAYRHLGRFRRTARFSTWLYRIVVNECKDFFRARARRLQFVTPAGGLDSEDATVFEVADPAGTPRDAALDRELAAHLSAAIRRLPDRQREAFVLCHLQDLPLAEAAEIMGCRLGTVKAHLFRAGEALRQALTPLLDGRRVIA